MSQVTINMPKCWLVKADDYHEFEYLLQNYLLIYKHVSYEECGYDRDYVAVFWIDDMTNEVVDMIQKHKKEIEE